MRRSVGGYCALCATRVHLKPKVRYKGGSAAQSRRSRPEFIVSDRTRMVRDYAGAVRYPKSLVR
jgi:hypothetical protein